MLRSVSRRRTALTLAFVSCGVASPWACSSFGGGADADTTPEAGVEGSVDAVAESAVDAAPGASADAHFCPADASGVLVCADFDEGRPLGDGGDGLIVHEVFGSAVVDPAASVSPPASLLAATASLATDGGASAVVGIEATFTSLTVRGLRFEADVRIDEPCAEPWIAFELRIHHPDSYESIEVGMFPQPPPLHVSANVFHYLADGGLTGLGGHDLHWPLATSDAGLRPFARVRIDTTFGATPTIAAWLDGVQTLPVTPANAAFPQGSPAFLAGVVYGGTGRCSMRYDNVVFSSIEAP